MSYLNPPLSVLAYGSSWKERMETLLMWGVFDVGTRTLENYRLKEGQADFEAEGRMEKLYDQYHDELSKVREGQWDDVLRWALGMETLGWNVKSRDMAVCKAAYERLEAFSDQRQRVLKRDPSKRVFVRGLQTEWLARAAKAVRDNEKPTNKVVFTESHFAVLMAVLSKVGGHDDSGKPRVNTVTWPEIQYRAMGYLSKKEMDADLPLRSDGAQPLTQWQIDRRAKQLDTPLNYFVRYVPMIGQKALPAWYGAGGVEVGEVVKAATSRVTKGRGGWNGQWRRIQNQRGNLAKKVIDFDAGQRSLDEAGIVAGRKMG